MDPTNPTGDTRSAFRQARAEHETRKRESEREGADAADPGAPAREPSVRDVLRTCGVRGKMLGRLAPRLTIEDVRGAIEGIDSDPDVRDRAAVLVARLLDVAGLPNGRAEAPTPELREAMTRLERARRSHRGERDDSERIGDMAGESVARLIQNGDAAGEGDARGGSEVG